MKLLEDRNISYQAVGGHKPGYDLIVEEILSEIEYRKRIENNVEKVN